MQSVSPERLIIAVPKKGRLCEKVLELLKGSGIEFSRKARLDIATCTNLNATIVFLPAADIAMYVGSGRVDMGITGQDIIRETHIAVNECLALGIGHCVLAVQVPTKSGIKDPKELLGKRVVTSFPHVTKEYFDSLAGNADHGTTVTSLHGSVEAACELGLGECVVDLVETGETMREHGLEICSTIMSTQAVLISNPHSTHCDMIRYVTQRISGFLTARKHSYMIYNVARSLLEQAKVITPGKRAPSVTPTEDSEVVAVSVLVPRNEVQSIFDRLQALGATDLIVMDMANTRGFSDALVPKPAK